MARPPIQTGERFGRLLVTEIVRRHDSNQRTLRIAVCKCDCGQVKPVQTGNLANGSTESCGCLARELLIKRSRTHGEANDDKRTLEYKTWLRMKQRCYNANDKRHWPYYGGRGIRICERWRDSFENFLADMGRRPTPRHTIDRIDPNGNYEPSNCRWATQAEQNRNLRKRPAQHAAKGEK